MRNTIVKTLLACCLLLETGLLTAQSPKAFENAADQAFRAKDYYAALQYYAKVLEMEPTRLDLSYHYAEAARLFGAYGLAELWYEKLLREDAQHQFPDSGLQLAFVKKCLGKYEDAMRLYEQYGIQKGKNEISPLRKEAQQNALQCEWAMEKTAHPDPSVEVKPLSDFFNTPQPDFGTAVHDGKFYYSSFQETRWGDRHYPARPLARIMEAPANGDSAPVPSPLNVAKRHTAHAAFSPNDDFLIFNQCDYAGDVNVICELYFSTKTPSGWSEPVALPASINIQGYTATQPAVADAGNGYYWLYYVSDRPGGKGGLDLWRARFSSTGVFDEPENLEDLNTSDNDITPAFDARHQRLYYSTRGQWTLGGYDIYRVDLKNGHWSEPVHLDVPYNSSYDDIYFTPIDDETAYLTSNRTGSKRMEDLCCYDLFKVEYLPVSLEAYAFSKIGYRPLNKVVFSLEEVDNPENLPVVTHFSAEQNRSDFDIRRERTYRIIANREFYRPDTAYVTTSTFPPDGIFTCKLVLTPQVNMKVRTFHQWTKEPLSDVHIQLIETDGRVGATQETGNEGNEARLDVSNRRQFMVIAAKNGFAPDTVMVAADELRGLDAGETLVKNLFLQPATMSSYLPIALYFDNDHPDPRTHATDTKWSYEQTVEAYIQRKNTFIETYSAKLQGAEKEQAVARLGKFFDEEVLGGQAKLEDFAGHLGLFLASGASLNILVKAFASPLAKPEYNMALTQRRIASVRNYFRQYENGVFEPYLRSGQLKVSVLPLGESEAGKDVSDDSKDKRLSVYSPEASRERRAEILEVRIER